MPFSLKKLGFCLFYQGFLLVFIVFGDALFQNHRGALLILELRTLVLAGNGDPRGDMGHTDGGLDFIDVLPALPRAVENIRADVVLRDPILRHEDRVEGKRDILSENVLFHLRDGGIRLFADAFEAHKVRAEFRGANFDAEKGKLLFEDRFDLFFVERRLII